MNEESDGALVRRTCSGEPRAFDALVRRHEKTVYNAALRMLHDREEARDVTQTVFLKVYEHLGEYDPSHKFYSWIYRIALNESIKSLQRRKLKVEQLLLFTYIFIPQQVLHHHGIHASGQHLKHLYSWLQPAPLQVLPIPIDNKNS